MPRLGPKMLGVLLLGAVGVLLSYLVLEMFRAAIPGYPYETYPDRQPDPGTASTPRAHSLPLGPVAPTPPDDVTPVTPVSPTASSPPTPLPVQESAPTMALMAPAPKAPVPAAGPPRPAAPPPGNAHHGLAPSAPLAASPGGPEFHVQAGAFKQREYAGAVIRQLRANGYTATLVEGALLRVWVGPAMSRTAAERLAATLRSNGFEAILSPVR